ncbi:hypothetical protein ORI20_25260 [Mycobacterium sp. CVI_P3]|uniref:Uncharacterized protein n=1 Tax=Mycobacterium pinniadriaticum TaxID=2994102 RepID=A0ABT3SKF8_9MYCO|nr:hypothetical protein [Mycobacterium pinniadriaticum]MCX2933584.1 hypothetical protein [Mycobacterium pinniadriaticum]MCX2940006.1 hypothetical protein [Mycobacterium pinniadriaticum]
MSERFGGVVGESLASAFAEMDAAANGLADTAPSDIDVVLVAAWVVMSVVGELDAGGATAGASLGSAAAEGLAFEAVSVVIVRLVRTALLVPADSAGAVADVDFAAVVRPTGPALRPLPVVWADEVGRPDFPTLDPVLLWLDDEVPLAPESAWAVPVVAPNDAHTPTVRAPAPSQMETLLCGRCARCRSAARRAPGLARLGARCLAAMDSSQVADALSGHMVAMAMRARGKLSIAGISARSGLWSSTPADALVAAKCRRGIAGQEILAEHTDVSAM